MPAASLTESPGERSVPVGELDLRRGAGQGDCAVGNFVGEREIAPQVSSGGRNKKGSALVGAQIIGQANTMEARRAQRHERAIGIASAPPEFVVEERQGLWKREELGHNRFVSETSAARGRIAGKVERRHSGAIHGRSGGCPWDAEFGEKTSIRKGFAHRLAEAFDMDWCVACDLDLIVRNIPDLS